MIKREREENYSRRENAGGKERRFRVVISESERERERIRVMKRDR